MLTGMTMDIKAALREEAMQFADRVHDLMIAQLTSVLGGTLATGAGARSTPVSPGRPVTRQRLSQEAVEEALAQVIALLEKHPGGLRSEQIRTDLAMDKKLFQYAAHLGKTSDQLAQTGERRSTVYALPAKTSKALEAGRVIKRKKR